MTGGRKCGVCGKPGAGFLGLRAPGRWSELPARFRLYLWHCDAAACVAQAEARRRKALHILEPRAGPHSERAPSGTLVSGIQPDLFGV